MIRTAPPAADVMAQALRFVDVAPLVAHIKAMAEG
jgi:hypothetical protein